MYILLYKERSLTPIISYIRLMSELISTIFILLVAFQIKHFICDFPLQREYMLKKTLPGWEFFVPLCMHAGVHALFTLILMLFFAPHMWWLCLCDFLIHFTMDRIKSGPKYLGRFNNKNRASYWNCLGFDQLVHHLTHYLIVYIVLADSIS